MKKLLLIVVLILMLVSCVPTNQPVYTLMSESAYYVSPTGADTNIGSIDLPWKTVNKAVGAAKAGDTIYIREGIYTGILNGWKFKVSGTATAPITISNYPNEQAVLKMITTSGDQTLFACHSIPQWNGFKADYVKILGTDVTPRTLSNGIVSKKGIVMQGAVGEQSAAISISNCDNWEVSGVDFVDVAYGMFTFKDNWSGAIEYSSDNWYVHNNRVYGFYRESGMQFNGDNNTVENNEIYKATSRVDTPYGCQLLNFLGDHNIVRNNRLDIGGSTVNCTGILLEWDLADYNLIESNTIINTTTGIDIEGGDNNIIRNNVVYTAKYKSQWEGGIELMSYDNTTKTNWPCDESVASARSLIPPNDPTHNDYYNYYEPRNCLSRNNTIINNTVYGFYEGVRLYQLTAPGTVVKNNIFSNFIRGGLCFYQSNNGTCKPLTVDVTSNNNITTAVSFVDIANVDLHLIPNSPACTAGEGGTYAGAFPCSLVETSTPSVTFTITPSFTQTLTNTLTATRTETQTSTPTFTSTPVPSNTFTGTATVTKTNTVTPSKTNTPTATSTPTLECHKVVFLDNSIVWVCK